MNMAFPAKWSIANALGLSVGFVAALQTGFLLQFGFNFDAHWSPEALGQGVWLGYRFIGLLLGGTIFAIAQTVVLPPVVPRLAPWLLTGALGYGFIAVVMWPFWAAGLWGSIPGPVEPLLITIGGGCVMGVLQWLLLRTHAVNATNWLAWWLLGLLVSLPATFVTFFIVLGILKLQLSWPSQVALSGFVVGGVAGLLSARATRSLSFSASRSAQRGCPP
jgi:hypothetical protein